MDFELTKQLKYRAMLDTDSSKNNNVLKQLNTWMRVTESMADCGYFFMDEEIGEVKVKAGKILKRFGDDYRGVSSNKYSKLESMYAMVETLEDDELDNLKMMIETKKGRNNGKHRINMQSRTIKKERN